MASRLFHKLGHLGVRLWGPFLLVALILSASSVAALYVFYRGAVAGLPAQQAAAIANFFILASILVFVVVLALTLAVGVLVTRYIVRPLIVLSKGAAILGRGHLDYRVEVDARGEIGELAAELNIMAASLQRAQTETQAHLREISSLVEAGRAISSVDLQGVLDTLAKEAARAAEAQACAIYVLNESSLTVEPRSIWDQSGGDWTPAPTSTGEGVVGWVAQNAQALRVEDVHADSRFAVAEAACPYHSLMALPLLVSGRLVGALQVAGKSGGAGGFTPNDERLLLAFADQVALAIENAKLFGEEHRRARELALVNRISHAITASLDLETTLDAILALVRDLLPYSAAEICLWDAEQNLIYTRGWGGDPVYRRLAADVYTPDEGYTGWIFRHHRPLLIPDIKTFDEVRPKVDLPNLSLQSYVGVPLMAGEAFIGTLELVSSDANVYGAQDLETLQTVANQAAVAIDNARLFEEAQRTAREKSILYEATAALSSTLSVNDLLDGLAQRMARALNADECTISEWDEASGVVRAVAEHYPVGKPPQSESEAGRPLSGLGVPYVVADYPTTVDVLHNREPQTIVVSDPQADPVEVALMKQLGWKSLLMLPLVTRDAVVGLVEIYSAAERRFTGDEIRLAQALTSQAAIALDNARIFSLTDERLRRRVEELSGLQQVSQELNSTLDQDRILRLVLREVVRATGADFANVSLYDRSEKRLLAHVGFGFTDEEMARLEGAFYTGEGVTGRVLHTGQPALVSDVSQESDYMVASHKTRSEAVVPIIYAGDVAGVINLESQQLNAFNEAQLRYLEALSNQAAVAIRNTMAYEEQQRQRELLRQRADQLARLSEISHAFRSDQPLEAGLEEIVYAVQETLSFGTVLMSVVDGDPPALYRVAGAGIPIAEMERLKVTPQSLQAVMGLMQDRFRLGQQSYYISHIYKEIWQGSLDVHYAQSEHKVAEDEKSWNADDLCFTPLYDSAQQLIGLLSVDSPVDGRIPAPQTMETLELFANQAAMAVENARLFRSEQQRRRLADTLREVAAVVSSTLDVDRVIEAILDQLQHVVPYDSATVQVLRGDCLIVTGGRGWESLGNILGLTFSLADNNPNAVVARLRAPYIVPDTRAAYPAFREPPHDHIRSWLGVPLLFGDNLLGIIALDSVQLDHYTEEHAQVALTFASQAAMALQNAQLFGQVRQYADRLSVLNEVGVQITSILNVEKLIARVSQLVEDNFGYRANISLVEEGSVDWADLSAQSPNTPTVPDMARSDAAVPRQEATPAGGSEISIPLKVQERVLGVFEVRGDVSDAFARNEILVLQSLAGQTAVAISNAQLFERVSRMGQELEQRVQERTEALANTLKDLTLERDRVETLYSITRELAASLDLDRVLNEALSLINRAVGVAQGAIMLLDPGTGNLIYRTALGRPRGLHREGMATPYRRGVGLAGWVLESREAVIVPDVTKDPHWVPVDKEPDPPRRSALAVPLTAGEDVLGVLLLFHPQVNYFTQDHLKLVNAAAIQVATAINNAELYRLITDQAERLGAMLRTQRAEAAKHQAIVEGIADGVLVLDSDYHVVLMNPAASRILGINASMVEGQHVRQILGRAEKMTDQVVAQQLYGKLMGSVERLNTRDYSQTQKLSGLEFRVETEGKTIVVSVSPLPLGGSSLPSLVTVLRDITHDAEMERIKNEFISTVSHELRTPMTSIKGYTDLLIGEKVGTLSDQQRRFVQVIKTNADRLTALVNDFLDISRMETGRVKLKMEGLDMLAMIHTVADNFRGQMVEKELELVLDLPAQLPLVRGDQDRVIQILENLTSNAWKYTPAGGTVTVRAGVTDDFVQIDVSDTGIGIAEKDQGHIFDRFYRTEQAEVRAVDGTGLGLSIVKMLVDLLGGDIWVESRENQGTTFSFTLPIVLQTEGGVVGGEVAGSKILVVDDDEDITQLLRHQLEAEGYRVLAAQHEEDVLQLARREQPDLITLDILLDGVDGFDVLAKLKQDSMTAEIPVIIVSIVPDAGTRGLALGAAGYISKPFEERQVLAQIHAVLASAGTGGNGRLNRVLVVDDDRHIVDWLKEALTNNGFTVRGAYNGHEALALAREDSPDLILLDLKMPDMDGYEVIRGLRRQQATQGIPVIVITGYALDSDRDKVEILGMGVANMLIKPFSVETLVQEIKRVEQKLPA
jgi:PAS domain S-box-containing protein